MATWPKSAFLLFKNHLGDCDTDNERGLYVVNSLTLNNDTLNITAATTKSTFDSSTDEMEIAFTKPVPATTKRAIIQPFLGDFPGKFSLSDSPTTTSLSITAEKSSFSWFSRRQWPPSLQLVEVELTKLYVDVDLSLATATNIKVAARAAYDNDVYT